jgi:hypothetical protein
VDIWRTSLGHIVNLAAVFVQLLLFVVAAVLHHGLRCISHHYTV